jgi:hypothetical protein
VKKLPYDVIRLKSWDEYLSLAAESPYHNWAFRGQRDASLSLFSAVSRYLLTYRINPQSWLESSNGRPFILSITFRTTMTIFSGWR